MNAKRIREDLASLQRRLRFDEDADAEQMAFHLADILGELISIIDIIIAPPSDGT